MRSLVAKSAVVAALLSGSLLIAGTGPASASIQGSVGVYTGNGVNERACPSTSCTIYGEAYYGQGGCQVCTTTGTVINGDPYWYWASNFSTGVGGWSSAYYMYVYYGDTCAVG